MPRGILLIAGLAMMFAVSAQSQTTNPSTTNAPVNAPFGGPMLVTPSAAFPNPVPSAGISNAGRAGISDATNGIEATTAPSSPATLVSTPDASLPESTNQSTAPDLGTSTIVAGPSNESPASTRGASDASGVSAISLAEVSSRYKAEKGTRSAKVLSNEDVQAMLNNKSGVTMAKNMPPLGSGALEQGAQAQSTDAQSTTQSAQSTQQDAQTNASANQQGGTPQPAANKGHSADNGVSAENSTTPQVNQKQQSNDAQGSQRLPATATFLPLLGLLGLVSGGIGMWFRKFRN